MSQKKSGNQWQKYCEKKLSLESLESRQLLSALPLTANVDYAESQVAYFSTYDNSYVDFSVAEEAPLALQAESPNDIVDPAAPVSVTATANKLNIQFEADANEQYTVVVKGTDNSGAGKDVLEVKNVKAAANKIQDGFFTYNYNGKANFTYEISVVNGKFTKKEYEAAEGIIPNEILVGEDSVTTLSPFTFVATPGTATATSITFQQQNGEEIESFEGWTISAKFDGAKAATIYTVEGDSLVSGEDVSPYSITLNENGSVTIDGLQLNTKHSFQVAQTSENAESAYSKSLTIATTKEQVTAPEDVEAFVHCYDGHTVAGSVDVIWTGEADAIYTIAYTYTDAKGKVVTKNATTKATVNEDGEGSFTVTKLASNQEYTFSVSANKTKDKDASVFVAAEETVTTPTVIPAPTLKKVSATDTSITLQITNWDKMESALQEVDEDGEGGTIEISNGNVNWETGEGLYASFIYSNSGNEEETGWVLSEGESDESKMEIKADKNKSIATITITGLEANTNYSFQASAFSNVVNDNINTVAIASFKSDVALSKPVNIKTEITAYPPVTNLETSNVTTNRITVSWTASKPQGDYAITLTSESGKTITKTTKATSITISGLEAGMTYTVSVVAKADKNGSQSEATTTTVKTLGEIQIKKAVLIGNNSYGLDFGRDMTQSSGRLDFSVTASGSAYAPQDGKWHSDSFSKKYSMFYGNNAQYEAISYQMANPSANVLILSDDNNISPLGDDLAPVPDTHTETVRSSTYNIDAEFTTEFQRSVQGYSSLSFKAYANYEFKGNATVTLESGFTLDEKTGESFYIKAGVKMKLKK